jgi:hypothetical protein
MIGRGRPSVLQVGPPTRPMAAATNRRGPAITTDENDGRRFARVRTLEPDGRAGSRGTGLI